MTEKELRESLGFKDNVVYYYCSIEAMYSIFSNKSFWLTFLESSNDSMELRLAEKIIMEAIKELKIDFPSREDIKIFEQIELAPKDKGYKKYKPRYKYYGLSLVEDKDSLTHWERYANNAGGVCIGLNIALIENLFMVYALPDIVSDWLQAAPIVYSYEEQIKYAKSSVMTKIKRLTQEADDFRKIEHIYSTIYYTTLATLKPLFKHIGFASEKENRIYLKDGEAEATARHMKDMMNSPVSNDRELFKNISNHIVELASKLNVLRKDIRHGVFKDGIRSYYALNLGAIWSDTLVPEVVLGPKCYQNKNELKSFMKSCELYRTKLSVSKIPIR